MREILLNQGKIALVDDLDFERLSKYKWTYSYSGKSNIGYALRTYGSRNSRKRVYLHHEIIERKDGLIVDHINGNPLDNRRSNIRLVTRQQNQFNRTVQSNNKLKVKGVSLDKRSKKYRARIHFSGKTFELGLFEKLQDAKLAYDTAAIKYFGEHTRLE